MILEGIVTTLNEDGSPNISPMGPEVDVPLTQFVLKPFKTSRTYHNLKRLGEGVLNGILTARLGIAAIEVTRPLPFSALPRPTLTEVAGGVVKTAEAAEKK